MALGGAGVSLDTSTTWVAGVSTEVSSTFVRGASAVDSISTRASTAPARPRRSRSPNRARCSARKFVQGWRRARRSMGSTPGSATACAFRGAAACPGRKRRDDWLFGRREKDFMVSNKSVMGNLKAFCAVLHRPEQTGQSRKWLQQIGTASVNPPSQRTSCTLPLRDALVFLYHAFLERKAVFCV